MLPDALRATGLLCHRASENSCSSWVHLGVFWFFIEILPGHDDWQEHVEREDLEHDEGEGKGVQDT